MKTLFLSKRRPQGRDLLTRPYGRFFHIPRILSERGHDVCLLLLSYKKEARSHERRSGMTWITESVVPTGPLAYLRCAKKTIEKFKPDWVVGFSDTYYGILAAMLGKRYGIGSVIDAYDNYESYIPWLRPLHRLWRKALAKATLVTAAGPYLARFLASFKADKNAHIIPMASDPIFRPLDKAACRKKLGLSLDGKLLGYCGSLYYSRDVETMFRAHERLSREVPGLEMVATGRWENSVRAPEKMRHLGYLPDELVPAFLNSVDVLLVANRLSDFGKFSYPVKLYEAMRCKIPVVATDTPGANWILGSREEFLARPGDPDDLASKTKKLLSLGRFDYGKQNTWEDSAMLFEEVLRNEKLSTRHIDPKI